MRYLDLMALRYLLTHTDPFHRPLTSRLYESQRSHQLLDPSISLHPHQRGWASLELSHLLLMWVYPAAHRMCHLLINILRRGTRRIHP